MPSKLRPLPPPAPPPPYCLKRLRGGQHSPALKVTGLCAQSQRRTNNEDRITVLWKGKCFRWKLLRDQRRSRCSLKYTSVWHKPPFLCPKKQSQMSALRFLQIAREPAFSSHLWLQFPALTESLSSALHNSAPSSPGLSSSPKSNHFYKHCTLAEFLLVVFRS